MAVASAASRAAQLRDQLPDDRRLEARREVGAALAGPLGPELADRVQERRLEAAEAEVEPRIVGHRARELERGGIAFGRLALDRRATRVAKPEQTRRLVECLAGRIVERLAELLVPVVGGHPGEQRVAPARDQAEERGLERLRLEEIGRDMALQVIDACEGLGGRRSERLRRADPDQQRPDQPRAAGDRERVDVAEPDLGLGERGVDDRVDELEVVAGGDLGHDAAEPGVRRGLRRDHVRADRGAVYDRRAGVVAGGLEREDHRHATRPFSLGSLPGPIRCRPPTARAT